MATTITLLRTSRDNNHQQGTIYSLPVCWIISVPLLLLYCYFKSITQYILIIFSTLLQPLQPMKQKPTKKKSWSPFYVGQLFLGIGLKELVAPIVFVLPWSVIDLSNDTSLETTDCPFPPTLPCINVKWLLVEGSDFVSTSLTQPWDLSCSCVFYCSFCEFMYTSVLLYLEHAISLQSSTLLGSYDLFFFPCHLNPWALKRDVW